jgi:hypothetical protein
VRNHDGEADTTTARPSSAGPSAANVSVKKRSAVPARPTAKTPKPVGSDAKSSVARYGLPQQVSSELP